MKTLRERYIAALINREMTKIKETSKYVCFYDPKSQNNFYVGWSGGLRFGTTIGCSHPCSKKFKNELLHPPKPIGYIEP